MFAILLCSAAGVAVIGSAVYTARTIDQMLIDSKAERRAGRFDASV